MYPLRSNRSGFSTIIAILITAFLTMISAGILGLFITESKISHSLYNGISTYAAAEGALEYAMLKIKNHREGFSDSITKDDGERLLLSYSNLRMKEQVIEYSMNTFAKAYTGTMDPGTFEVIPLFFDQGTPMQLFAKNPNPGISDTIKKTDQFIVRTNASLTWNIIGNNSAGETFGIVGSASPTESFGNTALSRITEGDRKEFSQGKLQTNKLPIANFLHQYSDVYLVLYNHNSASLEYSIESNNGFSLPKISVLASARVGNTKRNIELHENRSKFYDLLKYSLFNK